MKDSQLSSLCAWSLVIRPLFLPLLEKIHCQTHVLMYIMISESKLQCKLQKLYQLPNNKTHNEVWFEFERKTCFLLLKNFFLAACFICWSQLWEVFDQIKFIISVSLHVRKEPLCRSEETKLIAFFMFMF